MSVLKQKRTTSKAEFINTAYQIYVETLNFLTRLNFQCVWTDGNNNNNNANYSAGVRPGFCKDTRLHGVAENRLFSFQVKDNRCKRSYTSQGIQSLKLPFDGPTRTLLAWWMIGAYSISCVGPK